MLRFIRDFNMRDKKFSIVSVVLLAFFLILSTRWSFSMSQDSSPRIMKFFIIVDAQPGGEDIASLIPINEGEIFSYKKISNSIKANLPDRPLL